MEEETPKAPSFDEIIKKVEELKNILIPDPETVKEIKI